VNGYLEVSWAQLKSFIVSRNLSIQWIDFGDHYELRAADNFFSMRNHMDKSPSDTTDLLDFENNFKNNGNKPQGIRLGDSDDPSFLADIMEIGADGIRRLRTDSGYGISSYWPQSIDISKLLPIGYGASLTVPAFPTIKPLGHYAVPEGKKFRLVGVMFKTSSSTNYLHLYTRKVLWNFSATSLGTPATPTLTAKTITGSGLSLLSTYRYKIVAYNMLGNSISSNEVSITLSGTQNAVSLTWTNLTGALDYSIYRTTANGATGTQKLLASTDQLSFIDILPDSDLDSETVPAIGTTSGNIDGEAFPLNYGTTYAVIDTMSPITTPTPLDIIYKNIYGEKCHINATPGAAAGSQVALSIKGLSNPLDSRRIKKGVAGKNKKRIFDVGVNDILSVGNTPATGSFVIYGHQHFFHMASDYSNRWNTVIFESSFVFNSNEEVIFGISGNAASTTTSRNDVILLGIVE
jgi:hypothetical protein